MFTFSNLDVCSQWKFWVLQITENQGTYIGEPEYGGESNFGCPGLKFLAEVTFSGSHSKVGGLFQPLLFYDSMKRLE